jgi:hypothetical protein
VLRLTEVRLEFDQEAGWPPRLKGGSEARCLAGAGARSTFSLEDQVALRDVALCDARVRELLDGRWELLGIHQISVRETDCGCRTGGRVRACFYNYSSNKLVDVFFKAREITSIQIGEPHQHPEAHVEMAQAIALAKAHPQIGPRVGELDAHAILRVPNDPAGPSYLHRCLLVIFTEPYDSHRESREKYSALVDLCEQRVVARGSCSCDREDFPEEPKGCGDNDDPGKGLKVRKNLKGSRTAPSH